MRNSPAGTKIISAPSSGQIQTSPALAAAISKSSRVKTRGKRAQRITPEEDVDWRRSGTTRAAGLDSDNEAIWPSALANAAADGYRRAGSRSNARWMISANAAGIPGGAMFDNGRSASRVFAKSSAGKLTNAASSNGN